MFAFDSNPICLYQSQYAYRSVAINAKVAEKTVSESKLGAERGNTECK
jgi:hypothetical protein